MFTKNLLNSLSTLATVVEGDTGDKVMEHMGLDNVVEDVLANEAKVTVNGSSGTTGKVPLSNVVMGEGRVRVLQVSDKDKPVVDPEVGDNVVKSNGRESPLLDGQVDKSHGSQNTNVRDDNVHKVLLVKDRRRGKKVVGSPLVSVGVLLASNVGEKVHNPAKELLKKNVPKGKNGSVLGSLGDVSNREELLLSLGNENHISLEVTSSLVVLTVRDSPGVVGDKKGRVKDPANNVVDSLRVGESAVAALVGKNPAASTKETLDKAISNPSNNSKRDPRDQVEISVGSVGKKTNKEKVSGDVGKGLDVRALVAFSGNGVENFLDGELRDNKGLTVGVDGGFDGTLVLVELVVGAKAVEVGLGTALSESVCDGLRHCGVM